MTATVAGGTMYPAGQFFFIHDPRGDQGLTDAMRWALFEHTFGITQTDAGARAAFLRRIGVPADQIAGFSRPGLHAGTALGGAHVIDVQFVVEHVLPDARKAGDDRAVEQGVAVESALFVVGLGIDAALPR